MTSATGLGSTQPLRQDQLLQPQPKPDTQQQQQQQQQPPPLQLGGSAAPAVAVALPQPLNRTPSFEEISKLFNLPIAEAANILGVCTSVLKRICRDNGIIRWPYRKFLAGKTVEDIKKDAARERTKELAALSNISKQRVDASKVIASASAGSSLTFGNQFQNRIPSSAQEMSKLQRGASLPGHVSQLQGSRVQQNTWPSILQTTNLRGIPTFMDEFKYGFPSNGLSSASMKWWGSGNKESTEVTLLGESKRKEEENQESCDSSNETSRCMVIDNQSDHRKDVSTTVSEPSALLCSLRRKAVEYGRESLKAGFFQPCNLGKRQRLALSQVFKSSFPDQHADKFS